jgi:hypothetical protein
MEQWIKDNFEIVDWKNEDGTNEEAFAYIAPNGNKRITKLNFFLNNQEQFQDLIDYWISQGYEVPQ